MVVLKVIIGALIGAGVGALIGRSPVCSKSGCNIRNRRIPSIVAGAVCGALVGYRVG